MNEKKNIVHLMVLLVDKNEFMTYIQWLMVRNVMN